MKFEPRTEKELREKSNIAPGLYDFLILDALMHVSAKGNEMIKLKLGIEAGAATRIIYDYLSPVMEFKLRHFAESVGLLNYYESGELLPEHCIGRTGKVQLAIQKDKTGEFPDRTVVRDYEALDVPQAEYTGNQLPQYSNMPDPPAPKAQISVDDIPF